MVDDRRPRLLVGSSSEGIAVAREFKTLLEPTVDITLWNDGFFVPGEFTLESLERRSKTFDGALVVGTLDDTVTSRGATTESVRDNLLLEFGIFVATFGRHRALLALEGLGATKVPSDLFGLTCVPFVRTDPLREGLLDAVEDIKRAAREFSVSAVSPRLADNLDAVLHAFLGELQQALGGAPNVGMHVWVVDRRFDPPRLVRVARSRTSPKAQLAKEFAEGEGLVGESWRTASSVFVDFREEPYMSASEKLWNDFGPSVRQGMSFELLSQSRDRYRLVGASPVVSGISSGTEFLGCISYNVTPNVSSLALAIDRQDVERVLDKSVEIVRILLEK